MARYDPAQLVLAFEGPEAWAEDALRTAMAKLPCQGTPLLEWTHYPTTAGRAFMREFRIRLSSVVLRDHAQVYDTVLHEYAHLYVFERYGVHARPHGPEWKRAMKKLGLPARVTHNYPVERRTQEPKHYYRCNLCGFILSRVRPFKRNRIYSHVGCGGVFAK
jgi:predicted SprT family Zn-dependent metalloprotease